MGGVFGLELAVGWLVQAVAARIIRLIIIIE
jgi:hypothetical protein